MSIHKLTAGDGYSYLTRQVAALDATDLGHTGLADYYRQRGESPGTWPGSALAAVDLQAEAAVTAARLASLFGGGQHADADAPSSMSTVYFSLATAASNATICARVRS